MNCTKFFSVFLFSILTLLGVAADEIDRATPFQIKLFKFNDAYAAELLKNDTMLDACNTDALNALIDEAISDDVIWGSKVNGETASFAYMLSAYLNHTVSPDKIKNPFLIYMLSRLARSDKFKKNIELQKETLLNLLRLLNNRNYESHHRDILRFVFFRFPPNSTLWDQELKKFVQKELVRRLDRKISNPSRYSLLYWFFDWTKEEKESLIPYLNSVALQVTDFKKNNLFPWLSLLILADCGKQEAIDQVSNIANSVDSSQDGIIKATYLFPYLSLLRRNDIVDVLVNFLDDDTIIDHGDDINIRYVGLSSLAASAIFTMLSGAPPFSLRNFTQQDREKLRNWVGLQTNYNFKSFDYWQDDPITKRMRYMIFEAE